MIEAYTQNAVAAVEVVSEGVITYPAEFFSASRPTSALDIVLRVPGFTFDPGERVRGFEGAAGNVLIDGQRPASKTDDLTEVLRRIPASQVAKVELVRGGIPGMAMQGQSVVVNVVRRQKSARNGMFTLAHRVPYDGRQLPYVRLESSGSSGDRGWEVSVGAGRFFQHVDVGEGVRLRAGPGGYLSSASDISSEADDVQILSVGAYESSWLGGKVRANARLFGSWYEFGETAVMSYGGEGEEVTRTDSDLVQGEISLRFSREFSPRSSLELVALQQGAHREVLSDFSAGLVGQTFSVNNFTGERIGRAVWRFSQRQNLSWEFGLERAFNWLDSEAELMVNAAPITLPAADVRVEESRGEAFVKFVWRTGVRWTLEGGLRIESSTISSEGDVNLEKSLSFFKPRVLLTWNYTPSTQFRLRLEREVGQLNFQDFVASSSLNTGVVIAGNPNLEPQQAWVAEAALERRFWGKGVISMTLRHQSLTDAIDRVPIFSPGGVFDSVGNIGDGWRQDVLLDFHLPFDRLGLTGGLVRASAAWKRSEVTDPTTGEKRELSNLNEVDWEVNFSHDVASWNVSYGLGAAGPIQERAFRFSEVETFHLKTFVFSWLEWKPRADVTLRFEANNLAERGTQRTRQVYAGPRHSAPLLYTDHRHLSFGKTYYFRLQKTF